MGIRITLESFIDLTSLHLEGAHLRNAHLERANLLDAHLEGAWLNQAKLTRQVDLQGATFDVKTELNWPLLDVTLQVADVLWNGVPLIRVDWSRVPRLGDEAVARQARRFVYDRPNSYEAAARAYHQLAIALRGQGITEVADRFAYRALIMQRKALRWKLWNPFFLLLNEN